MKRILLKAERLDCELVKKLEGAVEQLSQYTGENYFLGRALFGKIPVFRAPGVLIAGVVTDSRPATTSLIAVDDEGNSLLPSTGTDIFAELCRKLALASEEDIAELRELVYPTPDDLR